MSVLASWFARSPATKDGGDGDGSAQAGALSPEMASHIQKMRAGVVELQASGLAPVFDDDDDGNDDDDDLDNSSNDDGSSSAARQTVRRVPPGAYRSQT